MLFFGVVEWAAAYGLNVDLKGMEWWGLFGWVFVWALVFWHLVWMQCLSRQVVAGK